MIDLHYWTTPIGRKATILLEEAGLPYRVIPVNVGAGDQFKPEFLTIAPEQPHPGDRRYRARPAVERVYALVEKINTSPTVSAQSRALLFGHTAASA